MIDNERRVLIVTPSYNGAGFIDETIYSVLSQATSVPIHYHVQDGGSSDGTLEKLRNWADVIEREMVPRLCPNLHFTFASERDRGMYDAINLGFAALEPQAADILTWINSDDRLAPGAVATLAQVFEDVPECEFLSGRISLLNEGGSILGVSPATGYARACLAAGLHDGRRFDFVMQEGTFFSGRIWQVVDGVDSRFRLAGDWDLWRRLAGEATHYTLDSVTAFHRRRHGQLSGDMDRYYSEVDAALAGSEAEREAVLLTVAQLGVTAPDSYNTNLIRFDSVSQRWIPISFNPHGSVAPGVITSAGYANAYTLAWVDGVFAREGPYPEYGLPGAIRWMSDPTARGIVSIPSRGSYTLHLLLRASAKGFILEIGANGQTTFSSLIPGPLPMRNEAFQVPLSLHAGLNEVTITASGSGAEIRRLLLIEAYVVEDRRKRLPPLERVGSLRSLSDAGGLNGIAVIAMAGRRPDLLRETVASVRAQVLVPVCLIVCTEGDGATEAVLREISDHVDIVLPKAMPAGPEMEAILDDMRIRLAIRLDVGDLLAPGALDTALAALARPEIDEVNGLIELHDREGRLSGWQLPVAGEPILAVRPTLEVRDARAVVRSDEIGRALLIRRSVAEPVATPEDGALEVLIVEPGAAAFAEGTALQNLAATFAMLGADVRYIGGDRTTGHASRGRIRFGATQAAPAAPASACVELTVDPEGACRPLRIGEGGELPIDTRAHVDTAVLVPRSRWWARQVMMLPPTAFIIAVTADIGADALAELRATLAGIAGGGAVKLARLGQTDDLPPADDDLVQLGTISDDLTLSYALSSVDILVSSPHEMRLQLKAAACGIPVLWSGGSAPDAALQAYPAVVASETVAEGLARLILDSGHRQALGHTARRHVESYHSLAAAAIRLRDGAAFLPSRDADWLRSRVRLGQVGPNLRIGAGPGDVLPPLPPETVIRLVPGAGTSMPPADPAQVDRSHGLLLDRDEATMFVALPRMAGQAVRLRFSGKAASAGRVRLDQGPWIAFALETGIATVDVSNGALLEPGLHRLEIIGDPPATIEDQAAPVLVSHASLLSVSPAWDADVAVVLPETLGGRYREQLRLDGDWHHGPAFHDEEPAYPALGLHAPVRWSKGPRCGLRTLIVYAGRRRLCVAVTGIIAGQQLRPIVAGVAASFCAPLDGVVGRVHHLTWMVDVPEGEIEIGIELSACQTTPDSRSLGIIILGLTIGAPPSAEDRVEDAQLSSGETDGSLQIL